MVARSAVVGAAIGAAMGAVMGDAGPSAAWGAIGGGSGAGVEDAHSLRKGNARHEANVNQNAKRTPAFQVEISPAS